MGRFHALLAMGSVGLPTHTTARIRAILSDLEGAEEIVRRYE